MASSISLPFAGISLPRRKWRQSRISTAKTEMGIERREKIDLGREKNGVLERGRRREKLASLSLASAGINLPPRKRRNSKIFAAATEMGIERREKVDVGREKDGIFERGRRREKLVAFSLTASLSLSSAGISLPPRKRRNSKIFAAATEMGMERIEKIDEGKEKDGVLEGGRRREKLAVLYEDGFGEKSVKDYLEWAREMIRSDGGPRWFCPLECGAPLEGSPLLLFLPGSDGVGLGLILHHKSLGKVFEVSCLHIPVNDRTPFEDLVKLVEDTIRNEHAVSPNRPIYLIGDSFGGCLALAVAARNPKIDLVLILCNPATSFGRSQLQPFLPILDSIPDELHATVPYMLSFIMGDPLKMAMANLPGGLSPSEMLQQISKSLTSLLPGLSDLADIIPKETLSWKLKLLNAGAAYANSRLHAVRADVLVLCSGKDNMLPSAEEARRLKASLKSCKIRYFKDNGHTLLMEDGLNLLTVIKATNFYRRSRKHDSVSDFLPPSMSEFKEIFENETWFNVATSPVFFSTLEDGKIVRGLSGIPDEGPVLLVGYHMLMGLELGPLYEEFLREKRTVLHGMAHPMLFSGKLENDLTELSRNDLMKVFGALPVSPLSMYKLLSEKSFVLLYPGGAREALHRKGEEYTLFWPDQPEFVRMAARFEATIIPFGVMGEDDVAELVLDYEDLQSIPFVRDWIQEVNDDSIRVRDESDGEVAKQDLHIPGLLPKIPGRFYYLFGKPIKMAGMKNILKERESASKLYHQTKSDVENLISYLKKKREEDPYRSIMQRTLYQASRGSQEVPTFET